MEYRTDLKYFIKGELLANLDCDSFPIINNAGFIYEVFKIKNSKALFLKEHLQRLNKSLQIKHLHPIDVNYYAVLVDKLLEANNRTDGNIKIIICYDAFNKPLPIMYYIPHHYPSQSQYKKGIKVALQYDTRDDPQAKIIDPKIRTKANAIIFNADIFETLLVNGDNKITEGSRSNVFFIAGDKIITAPDNMVLLGVSRDKIIALAKEINIIIRFEALTVDELHNINAAFITGTSPGILQIRAIEDLKFEIENPIYSKLFEAFNS